MHTAAGFPANGRLVNASTWVMAMDIILQCSRVISSRFRRTYGLPEGAVRGGMRHRLPQRAIRFPAPVPSIPRRGIRKFRGARGLAAERGVDLRAPDVPARPQRRLCRTVRRRLAGRVVALDAGLSASRPALLAGAPPL